MNFVPNAFSVFPTLYPAHFTAGMMCCRRFSFCFCDSFRAKARLYMLPECHFCAFGSFSFVNLTNRNLIYKNTKHYYICRQV